METVNFSDLGLSIKDKTRKLTIGDKEIEVLQYLPTNEKNTLIQLVLQQSEENGIYNELALTVYFYTYVVFFYTNLEFTDEQKQDVSSTFDILDSNDVITKVIQLIPEEEWMELKEFIQVQKNTNMVYKKSAAYLIGQFINELPSQMDEVAKIINNFDPSKYQAVIDFATAANGGRNINTNKPVAPVE